MKVTHSDFRKRGRWPLAWRISQKLIGRRPLLMTAAILGLLLLMNLLPDAFSQAGMLRPVRLVESIVPLMVGLQAAFLFSPEDEPGLELLATAGRPLAWLPLERLLLLLMQLGGIAIVTSLIAAVLFPAAGVEMNLWHLTGRWLLPALVLGSLALCGTLISRQGVVGAVWVVIVWWAMLFPADGLLAERPAFWPLHLYLQPGQPHYVANRLLWLAAGIGLLLLALRQLGDLERLLAGPSKAGVIAVNDAKPAGLPSGLGQRPAGNGASGSGRLASLAQLWAVAGYEHRLHWRRRTVLVVMLIPCLISLLIALRLVRQVGGGLDAALQEQNTIALLLATWLPLYVGLQTLPPIVADAMAKDRQLGTSELWSTLPVRPAVYLLGKLLGTWWTVLLVLAGAIIGIGLLWRLWIGAYDTGRYLEMAFVGALPLALTNTGLIVLLTAGFATRRQAALAGTALTIFCVFTMFFVSPFPLVNAINPARPALLRYFLQAAIPALADFGTPADVLWSISGGAAELVLVGLLAWLWLRRQESYA